MVVVQPLPKLELLEWMIRLVVPVREKAVAWDAAKLADIKARFRPYAPANGMGCMMACYDVLAILYGDAKSKELRREIWQNAKKEAVDFAKAHPAELKKKMEDLKAANPGLADEAARNLAIEQWTSRSNTADHLFRLMQQKGQAGEMVETPNKDADQVIRELTGNAPGAYIFGMTVKDNHTVTLAVEKAADGTQKIYWMDQMTQGLRREIKPGKLGEALEGVWEGHTHRSKIYPLKPDGPVAVTKP